MNTAGLYVHIPFCTVKCGYCDFNAYPGMHHLAGRYLEALLADIECWRDTLTGRQLTTIAFGGGTPSEVPAGHIAAVIDRARSTCLPTHDIEVSLEANPGSVGAAYFRDLRAAGVNRLSIGAQSFEPAGLAFLDRMHSPEATVAAVSLARDAGFENLSLDLIYGLPGQTLSSLSRTLEAAIALRPEHLSVYALTVEDGTPLDLRVASGEVSLPDDDVLAGLYEHATEALERAGFRQYEISNWARPGYESRHNSSCWRYGEYVGIGAGAHGFVGGRRHENVARPPAYIEALLGATAEGVPHPAVARSYVPEGPAAMADWLSLRLRLLEGFAPAEFARVFGARLDDLAGDALDRLRAAGVVDRGSRVRLTRAGRLLHGEAVVQLYVAIQAARAPVRSSSIA